MHKPASLIVAFFLILLQLTFCFSQKIEYKNGIKIIHNGKPLWGNNPKVVLEFVRKIGELEGDDENYQLYQPQDVIRDSKGNIYVIEVGNNRIQSGQLCTQYDIINFLKSIVVFTVYYCTTHVAAIPVYPRPKVEQNRLIALNYSIRWFMVRKCSIRP